MFSECTNIKGYNGLLQPSWGKTMFSPVTLIYKAMLTRKWLNYMTFKVLSDLKTLWFRITYFHYWILNGENSFNVALFRAKMKVQNWICDVTANSYNRAGPELIVLEHERQVVTEMESNSPYDKKWPSGGEKKLKERTLMLYKEKKTWLRKIVLHKERKGDWKKRAWFLSFLFSKQMGIW